MNLKYSESQSMFLRQAFTFFSSTPELLNIEDLDRLLKIMGKHYEPIALVQTIEEVNYRNDEMLDFNGFLTLMSRIM